MELPRLLPPLAPATATHGPVASSPANVSRHSAALLSAASSSTMSDGAGRRRMSSPSGAHRSTSSVNPFAPEFLDDPESQLYRELWKHNRAKWSRAANVDKMAQIQSVASKQLTIERAVLEEERQRLDVLRRISTALMDEFQDGVRREEELKARLAAAKRPEAAEADVTLRKLGDVIQKRKAERTALEHEIQRKNETVRQRHETIVRLKEAIAENERRKQQQTAGPPPETQAVKAAVTAKLKDFLPTASAISDDDVHHPPPSHGEAMCSSTDPSIEEFSGAATSNPVTAKKGGTNPLFLVGESLDENAAQLNQDAWLRSLRKRRGENLEAVFEEAHVSPLTMLLSPKVNIGHQRDEARRMVEMIEHMSPAAGALKSFNGAAEAALFDVDTIANKNTQLEETIEAGKQLLTLTKQLLRDRERLRILDAFQRYEDPHGTVQYVATAPIEQLRKQHQQLMLVFES